ncbi:MAG: histidine--tRNA ligase [Microgenomates group bacterium]
MQQNLKGFRDFLPEEKSKRDYIIANLKKTFELFNFQPLETPTLEYADLLLGKYGQEADKLIYTFTDKGGRQVALKYDQTVPTARILSQYRNFLPKYFRRYQIQNVFRAEKPQKGRYREFTQCDIDIFGSESPIADAEIIATTYYAFINLGFKNFKILINDRQILFENLKEFTNKKVGIFSLIQSLDKIEKINEVGVIKELEKKGLSSNFSKKAIEKLKKTQISSSLKQIIELTNNLGVPMEYLEFNPFLARGLDYYTGVIIEVKAEDYPCGSLAGGGRYDNLIKQIAQIDIPAVGLAFGLDRITEVMQSLKLFPDVEEKKILVTIFDPKTLISCLQIASNLRQWGFKTEVYPELEKLDKQLKFANKQNFNYVIIFGEQEKAKQVVIIKKMKEKKQIEVKITDLKNYFQLLK